MEFKLDKRYPLPVPLAAAWSLLSDVRATAACLPGAAITEQLDERRHKGLMKAKVGPATMNFSGEVEVLELDAASRTLRMLGKGADKAGSTASMQLSARLEPGESEAASVLVGQATVVVSGKLAQFGSRLLVPVSDALLAQFVGNFASAAGQLPSAATGASADAAPPQAGTDAPATDEPSADGAEPSAGRAAAGETAGAAAPAPARAHELNALALLWSVFRRWLAGLFGRRGSR